MIPIVFKDHFQHAYVVRNAEKVMANFKEKFGVSKWQVMPMPDGLPIRSICLAYVQDVMLELIEAVPGMDSIYRSSIPDSDTAARFHHLGYLIADADEYRKVADQFTAAGYAPAMAGSNGDILDFHYADTVAELGHYCELVHLRPGGKDFFSQVPKN